MSLITYYAPTSERPVDGVHEPRVVTVRRVERGRQDERVVCIVTERENGDVVIGVGPDVKIVTLS
jgi:hypothetical protein